MDRSEISHVIPKNGVKERSNYNVHMMLTNSFLFQNHSSAVMFRRTKSFDTHSNTFVHAELEALLFTLAFKKSSLQSNILCSHLVNELSY